MLQFLNMLKGGQGAMGQMAGKAGGQMGNQMAQQGGGQASDFFKALGADKMGQSASQAQGKAGTIYGRMGDSAPDVPNMMSAIGQMGQMSQGNGQRQDLPTGQINPLLQMLLNGGR